MRRPGPVRVEVEAPGFTLVRAVCSFMPSSRDRSAALRVWLDSLRDRIGAELPGMLPLRDDGAAAVHDAMRDALLSPGKRIRPSLVLAVGEIFRAEPRRLIPSACAIEMVHTSSLILDDLPCMDDARTRRGNPACHVVHGEATAILAAVGLLNHAFGILAGEGLHGQTRDRLRTLVVRRVSAAIGTDGVIGGQAADLAASADVDLPTLEFIHSHKTGSLFIAAAEIGAHLSGATPRELDALSAYAKNLGLAFQITDDLIDAVGTEQAAGKPVRADDGKATFVSMCGVEGARTLAGELVDSAIEALFPFGTRAARLADLARFVATRDR